jgi:hypothetical protein
MGSITLISSNYWLKYLCNSQIKSINIKEKEKESDKD